MRTIATYHRHIDNCTTEMSGLKFHIVLIFERSNSFESSKIIDNCTVDINELVFQCFLRGAWEKDWRMPGEHQKTTRYDIIRLDFLNRVWSGDDHPSYGRRNLALFAWIMTRQRQGRAEAATNQTDADLLRTEADMACLQVKAITLAISSRKIWHASR